MTVLAVVLLGAAGAGFAHRLLAGPSVADRVVAVDALVLLAIAGVSVGAAVARSTLFLDVVVVLSLVAFIGTAIAARFIERRGL